jgi:hypothetical protein
LEVDDDWFRGAQFLPLLIGQFDRGRLLSRIVSSSRFSSKAVNWKRIVCSEEPGKHIEIIRSASADSPAFTANNEPLP